MQTTGERARRALCRLAIPLARPGPRCSSTAAGRPAIRAYPSAAPVATPSNSASTPRMAGTSSMALTKCISEVPGLVKKALTPAPVRVAIRDCAPVRPGVPSSLHGMSSLLVTAAPFVPTIDSVTQPHNPAETARQWVVEPDVPPVPVVACVPHGGRDFPAGMAGELYVRPDRLWADWLTRELYAFAPELGITTVTTSLSRFVADVNRDPASGHGAFWSTVVSAQQPNTGR